LIILWGELSVDYKIVVPLIDRILL
jgi:hypothetical protein